MEREAVGCDRRFSGWKKGECNYWRCEEAGRFGDGDSPLSLPRGNVASLLLLSGTFQCLTVSSYYRVYIERGRNSANVMQTKKRASSFPIRFLASRAGWISTRRVSRERPLLSLRRAHFGWQRKCDQSRPETSLGTRCRFFHRTKTERHKNNEIPSTGSP